MRILTLDELYKFCQSKKIHKFSSNETGSQIVVSVPAQFEIDDKYVDDTLLFAKVKLMHSGENRNHSSVTDKALKKAGKGLAYKPILANFMEYVDEDTGETLQDFTSHDMILNNDGTTTYLEKQIGSFTSDEPFYEVEESTGHNFLYGYCAIPREYTPAADIIERKNGTKISVELAVNELEYNSKDKVLELTDVIILGATCLGKNPDTLEDVGEGMLNARLDTIDIADFSVKKDSVQFSKDEKLIEILEKLNTTLSNFNKKLLKEGGIQENMKFKELLEKYNKSIEDIDFDYKNMSDEELEAKFAELFEDDLDVTDQNTDPDNTDPNSNNSTDSNSDPDQSSNDNPDPEPEPEVINDDEQEKNRKFTINDGIREFAISLNEKIHAISELVNATYSESDNTYYFVTAYDKYVIMEDWWNGKYFKQTYSENDGVFTLTGDRVQVYAEYVTADEMASLDEMRSNYSSIKEELDKYKYAEEYADKMTVFDDVCYSDYLDTDEFKNIMKKEFVDQYSKEELAEKADAALGKLVKVSKKFSFTTKVPEKKVTSIQFAVKTDIEEKKPYGNLFD